MNFKKYYTLEKRKLFSYWTPLFKRWEVISWFQMRDTKVQTMSSYFYFKKNAEKYLILKKLEE